MVWNITQPFASQLNFLDPQTDDQGNPWGPVRYKELVKERYYIAKQGHLSYDDVGKMTPTERDMIRQFILEDAQATQKALDDMKHNRKG